MIQGATSIMWAERYRDPGEFEIVGTLSSGLREFLPIGTFISHADTLEVMYVENHEIDEDENEDPIIKITGRSLEAFFENRIIGITHARLAPNVVQYQLVANYTWDQLVSLINYHIDGNDDPNDNLDNVMSVTNVTGTGPVEERWIKQIPLSKAVLDLLAIDDLGIKILRRNTFGAPDSSSTQTNILIHRGNDRTANVIFSWKAGDIEKTQYLWSDKRIKNSALVVGRFVNTVVDTVGANNFNRRTMVVSADEVDGQFSEMPTGTDLDIVLAIMAIKGMEALDSQNRITITSADLANISKYQYRKDFEVGDLVTLDGNFGQIATMRIVEYVEIQDETGESGHPTLSLPEAQTAGLKYGRTV
jgi:hypothetical protein